MKFLLLKTLLLRRAKDEGFVIPVVIALGLIMILLGTFSIVKSSDENIGAITQRSKSIALAAAEAGIARYQELLSRNRAITMYGHANWTDPDNLCNTDTEITNAISSNNFQDVVTSTSTYDGLGQYRLVSYEYLNGSGATVADGTNPNNNTIGRLTVEGRANSNDNGATRVQVDIPIRREAPDLSDLDPALWIGRATVTDIGVNNLLVGKDNNNDGDLADPEDPIGGTPADVNNGIIISNPAGASAGCSFPSGTGQPSSTNSRKLFSVPYDLPNTPPEPSNYISIDSNALNDLMAVGGQLPSPLGQDIDDARDDNSYYHYVIIGDLTLTNDLRINDGTKVILYVCGDITINNGGGPLKINDNPLSSNTSSNLEIYGNNTEASYSFPSCTSNTTEITFTGGGTTNIKALIHAPDATVRISTNETLNVTGAMWVNNWNDTSSGSQVTIIPDSYEEYLSRTNIVIPTLSDTTEWKTIVVP